MTAVTGGILVITTGGTIGAMPYPDPARPPRITTMPPAGRDNVRDELARSFAHMPLRCLPWEARDSNLIDKTYRDGVLQAISGAGERAILVTHGTDTILQSADYFFQAAQRGELTGKRLVLVGAMMPLANGAESDGYRNMAFALELLDRYAAGLPVVGIVLSDFDDAQNWQPKLYPYHPGRYAKYYDADGRYSRLREI